MKKLFRTYGLLFLLAGLVIALDQITKIYIRANFIEGGYDMWAPWDWMLPYARILYVTNTGVAFGMFRGMWSVFTVLAILVIIGIIYYYPRVSREDLTLRLAMGFQLGGATGNLIDRITQNGQVTDFISVGDFPVFNIADSSITIGVAIMLLGVWLQERRDKRAREIPSEEAGDASSTTDGSTG